MLAVPESSQSSDADKAKQPEPVVKRAAKWPVPEPKPKPKSSNPYVLDTLGFRNWMANHMARTPTTAAEKAMSAALSVPAKANPSEVEAKFQPPAKPIPGEKAKAKPTSTPQTKSRHSDYRLRNSPRQ